MRKYHLIWEQFSKEKNGYYESVENLKKIGIHRHIVRVIDIIIDSMSYDDPPLWTTLEKIVDGGGMDGEDRDVLISRIAMLINRRIMRNETDPEEIGLFARALHLLSV